MKLLFILSFLLLNDMQNDVSSLNFLDNGRIGVSKIYTMISSTGIHSSEVLLFSKRNCYLKYEFMINDSVYHSGVKQFLVMNNTRDSVERFSVKVKNLSNNDTVHCFRAYFYQDIDLSVFIDSFECKNKVDFKKEMRNLIK